jgi:hypothetical protein
MSNVRPLIVGWTDLRKMGWCVSRAHTWRLMFDPDYADDPFPVCRKLGKYHNSHPVWRVSVTGGVNPRMDGEACAGEEKGAAEAPGLFNGMAVQSDGLSVVWSV